MRIQDFTCFHSRLGLIGSLRLETSLRIGAGQGNFVGGSADINVVKDASGAPYIPGSSFKGVLRSHVEAVLRTIDPSLACLCVTELKNERDGCPTTRDSKYLRDEVEKLQEGIKRGNKPTDALDRFYFENSCLVCRVFGSPWLASKVLVRDIMVTEDWLGRYQYRNGVAIDRDTETASENKLYTFEVVPAGMAFECEIIIENGTSEEQGMVLLGLKAFEFGQMHLGGARSRGLGRVTLRWDWERCYEVDGNDRTGLLDYLFGGRGRHLNKASSDDKIDAFRKSLGV